MKKLLLHVCCGPCSPNIIKELKKEFDVTLYFYNPNIHPQGEYVKRLNEVKKLSKHYKINLEEGEYDVEKWFEAIRGFEHEPEKGRRCAICFAQRLSTAAKYAKEHDFDILTTTISVSPHKDAVTINKLGHHLTKKYEIEWLESDFKKNDGYNKSTVLSKELGLYRQDYCGCFYSVRYKPSE